MHASAQSLPLFSQVTNSFYTQVSLTTDGLLGGVKYTMNGGTCIWSVLEYTVNSSLCSQLCGISAEHMALRVTQPEQ